jgi:erythronate-4-phosphate dehydrogenase
MTTSRNIVCSSNMPFAREAFGMLGSVSVIEGRPVTRADLANAEILAIRSATKVDRTLLDGTPVRFVGTATIGTDHMDTDYLDAAGIRWCYSPGCNANSVAEYVTAALLCLATRHGFSLEQKTIGVVGVGNVGRLVVEKAEALGMTVLKNDPPRARAQGETGKEEFLPLDELVSRSNIVTLHVPLTKDGEDATLHMAEKKFFATMKPGSVFLNTARGVVVETGALLAAVHDGTVRHAVIDTWENEPEIRRDLLDAVDLGTPHIAGHSFEGKVMGTAMVYREACRFLGQDPEWDSDRAMPAPEVRELTVKGKVGTDEEVLWQAVRRVYAINDDDRRLRNASPTEFERLREDYPVRREFRFTRLRFEDTAEPLKKKFIGLGFAG